MEKSKNKHIDFLGGALNKVINNPMIFETQAYEDYRGYLSVIYDQSLPISIDICQINQGYSHKAFTLRGLHFQVGEFAQSKLVSCLHGKIFNVAVDLRFGKNFGRAYSEVLSFENRKRMYIPRGFAHGYLTLEDDTLIQWCVDNDFNVGAAKALRYDDPDIIWKGETWPAGEYIISGKDQSAMRLSDVMEQLKCK